MSGPAHKECYIKFRTGKGGLGLLCEKHYNFLRANALLTCKIHKKRFTHILPWYIRCVFVVQGKIRIVSSKCNIVI